MIDKIRERLSKVDKKIDEIVPMKSLLDENGSLTHSFVANGNKYNIMPANLVFNIKRRRSYENLHRMFATGKTPVEQYKDIKLIKEQLINMATESTFKKGISNLWQTVLNIEESFKNVNNKYSIGLYIATLFIIRDGENLKEWDFETADSKIEDWIKDNYDPKDFFSLALITSEECKEILKNA